MPVRLELFTLVKGGSFEHESPCTFPTHLFLHARLVWVGLICTIVAPTRSPSLFPLSTFICFASNPTGPLPLLSALKLKRVQVVSTVSSCLACCLHEMPVDLVTAQDACTLHMQRAARKLAIKPTRFFRSELQFQCHDLGWLVLETSQLTANGPRLQNRISAGRIHSSTMTLSINLAGAQSFM